MKSHGERAELAADCITESSALEVRSTQGLPAGQTNYVGNLSREAVKAVLDAVVVETIINLAEAPKLPQSGPNPGSPSQ